MLRVYYSNQTEELLRALAERIFERHTNPLEKVPLVVPSPEVGTFVQLSLALLQGMSWNVKCWSLRDFLASTTGKPTDETALLDRILSALLDESLVARPDLAPVRDYILAGGEADPPTQSFGGSAEARRAKADESVDRRRVQLARKLAHLFAEYEIARPELLECWRAGLFHGPPDFREVETWQRRLWLEIEGGLAPRVECTFTLPSAPIHVFGFSHIPRSLALSIIRLSLERDLFVYTLNPCREIWEKSAAPPPQEHIPRRYERRGSDLGPGEMFSIEDPFRLSNAGEMLPLRLWARPGRESLRLLNALSGCELVDRMRDPGGSSLLHQLQRDILLRKPERDSIPEEFDFASDRSLVVLECESPRRELESIAAEIWSLLRESESRVGEPPLRFNDIGILIVPSRADRYESLVASIFREAHGIPVSVVDLRLDRASPIAEAIALLLEIPLAFVSRSSLLRFATHPAVTASFPGARAEDWIRWGDAPELDESLTRLALAAFSRRDGDDLDPRAEALDSAAAFGALLRSLSADAKEATRAQMTLPTWMDFAGALVTTYLEPRTEAEERVLRSCLDAFAALAEMTLSGQKVRYHLAHELIRSALDTLSESRGQHLVDGVSVSRFLPMRPIPFRVLFVAGLSEGDFAARPARETEDGLDLRRAHRRAGDVGGKEEDRQLFLETLLSAREKLYVSYVSRDERTGVRLAPASVVGELLETLAHGYLPDESAVIRRPLTTRCEDGNLTRVFSEALQEKNALALGEHLKGHLGSNRLPPLKKLKRSLPERVARALSMPPIPARGGVPSKATLSLSLSSLREFLECPLQASARFHLRLHDGRRDKDDEREGPPPIRNRHLEVLAAWQQSLSEVSNGEARLAPPEAPGAPLVLTAANRRIEILRPPETRLETPPALLRLASRDPERFHPQKESLRGFLDHVFSSATGTGASEPYTFLAINAPPSGEGRAIRFRFAPIETEKARSYLEGLLSDMLSGVHEYLLPCEVIFGFGTAVKPEKTSSILGPVPHPEDYRHPEETDREALVQRRFGLYFESLLPPAERT